MRLAHKNNDGFGLVGVLATVAAVGLVGLAGWFVYRAQVVKSYDQCVKVGGTVYETYPSTCKKYGRTFTQPAITSNVSFEPFVDTALVRVDKTLELPATWKQIEGTDERLIFGGGPNDCALTASVYADEKAKRANAGSYTQELFKSDLERLAAKGFAVTKLAPGAVKLDGGDGASGYTTLELRAARDGQVNRETYAYIVGDGRVGRLDMYCRGSEYTGMQMGDEKGNDAQILQSVIIPALHLKVL